MRRLSRAARESAAASRASARSDRSSRSRCGAPFQRFELVREQARQLGFVESIDVQLRPVNRGLRRHAPLHESERIEEVTGDGVDRWKLKRQRHRQRAPGRLDESVAQLHGHERVDAEIHQRTLRIETMMASEAERCGYFGGSVIAKKIESGLL